MSKLFRYSIIRFRPYAEVGEFANVGIVVLDLSRDELEFKLAPKRFSRLRGFFNEAGYRSYFGAIDLLRLELARVADFMPQLDHQWDASTAFSNLIRSRESSIIFSESRVISTSAPLRVLVEQLYAKYIKREVAIDDPEAGMVKNIRRELHRRGLRDFKAFRVEDDLVPVTFPLAVRGKELHAIKPLAFEQKTALGVVDYGAHWTKRLSYLLDRKKITEQNVILALSSPTRDAEKAIRKAYEIAREELDDLPFRVVEGEYNGRVNPMILDFAVEASREARLFG